MKKLWRRVRKGSPARSGEASPKSSSTRGSVASLNIGYEVKEKDLGKLHKAAWRGDLSKVKQLAKKDPSPLDKQNRTPLHLACIQGHEYIVQELLEWKAKANIGDNQSKTPLMRAVEFQQDGCVNLLLSYHVDVDTVDAEGNTPLHMAVSLANLNIISMLIRAGTSLNTRNKEGFSALHMSVRNKHVEVCHLLLKEKADVNVEDTNLRTPLMLACQDGSVSLVKLLLEYNADTSHKDSKGWTADDCAVIQGHHPCSQLISDHNDKMNRITPSSTPRTSSQPPSLLNTPRDKNSIGLPVLDSGDADSDNETTSKVSGPTGSNSWADSPDVSVSGPKDKPAAPKINLAKFAKNIHVSESDTDGESLQASTPRKKITTETGGGSNRSTEEAVGAATAAGKLSSAATRQISLQSQMSAEDSSWSDSPVTPRKSSSQKVSFKKDEELSEIHDIVDPDADSDILDPIKNVGVKTSTPSLKVTGKRVEITAEIGYVPSAAANITVADQSADKLRAFMEELGISDVDDISEMSEDAPAPPLPASLPPKMAQADQDSDWDSSAVSGMISTPRPGILKKETAGSVNQEITIDTTVKSGYQQPHVKLQQHDKSKAPDKHELTASAEESGDESSVWDTTEVDAAPQVTQNPTAGPQLVQHRESHGDHDDDEWDSTFEAATPRANAGLFYSEVNVTGTLDVVKPEQTKLTPSVVAQEPAAKPANAVSVRGAMIEPEEKVGSSESSWDSEADDLPSNAGASPAYIPSISYVFGSTVPNELQTEQDQEQAQVQEKQGSDSESDEDTETMSSWEKERKLSKMAQGKLMSPVDLKVLESEINMKGFDDQDKQFRIQKGEEIRTNKDDDDIVKNEELKKEAEKYIELGKKLESKDIVKQTAIHENVELDKMEEQLENDMQWNFSIEREQEIKRQWKLEGPERKEEIEKQWKLDESEQDVEFDVHWNVSKVERQKEIKRQWKYEGSERQDIDGELEMAEHHQATESMWGLKGIQMNEALQSEAEIVLEGPDVLMDSVLFQQQELNRIDEQFQKERAEREHREEEERMHRQVTEDVKELSEHKVERSEDGILAAVVKSPPPVLPKPSVSIKASSPIVSGAYASVGGSTVQEIRQRLQVIPASTATLSSTGPLYPGSYGFDDEESLPSDVPGDERSHMAQFYQSGLVLNSHSLFRPHDPLDDDALSYTSTEVEDHVQSSPSYARDRDILASINIADPGSLLKVQEYIRDSRNSLEQERNQRIVLENKLRLSSKEKEDIVRKLENLTQHKSELEQTKLDLDAKIRSLEYSISEEVEKCLNAEVLLNKTKERLAKKESQLSVELEAKQTAELARRNLQIEMRTLNNTIKELKEEKEELQRQVTYANNARQLQEQISEDQQKLLQRQQQQSPKDSDFLESSFEISGDSNKLKAELYALKMEMDRQRSRFKDEISLMGAENEDLMSRVEELRNDIKLNEEALAHATMQYNIQMATLRTEISTANSVTERERTAKEKLEAEIDSLKSRLLSANQEMEKAIRARNEIEREQQREKEAWVREMDRKEQEVAALKENIQHLNQRLTAADSKLNSMENELHVSSTSLLERTSQLQHFQQEIERQKNSYSSLDQSHRLEKENSGKLQAKIESLQEKLSQQQHEGLSLRQQLDTLRLSGSGLPGSDTNEKLNSILTSLRAESDRARATLEEKNSSLLEQVARLKEESKGSEIRRTTLEQDLRRLREENSDVMKKLSQTEASLQIAMKAKEQLEQEKVHLKVELEKLQQRYQSTHDKSIEAQARVTELVDRLEKAENSSVLSHQQLANTSANIQGLVKSKFELDDSLQQLQIENAKLDAELKYEKQRADMLYQDLQDSQKVRSSLEALCSNLKSTSAHLEDRLGIADLERIKHTSESRIGEEKNRTNLANEERRALEAKLETANEKNQLLQRDVNSLKGHLKSVKRKIKAQYSEPNGDIKSELEVKYRKELSRKLDDVNRFLDSQSQLRDRLDVSRTEAEAHLLSDKRRLEEEINNLRIKFEQAVTQRETKEMEARRFRELYESEMKWRIRISDQLQLATERGMNLKSKLNNERQHRSRLTGSIGNLSSSLLMNNSFDIGRTNGFHDDELSNRIKAELDRSIAKHLEAAPHDHKPVIRPVKEPAIFLSSLTQSSQDYIDILKRKYCV